MQLAFVMVTQILPLPNFGVVIGIIDSHQHQPGFPLPSKSELCSSLTTMVRHLPAVSNFGEAFTCFQEASTSAPSS